MNSKKIFLYQKINQNQSGAKEYWVLEFSKENEQYIEPIMNWTGNLDSDSQVKMHFNSKEDALNFCKNFGYDVEIFEVSRRNNSRKIKPKTYAENFS
jgi:NADH dehydrogenase